MLTGPPTDSTETPPKRLVTLTLALVFSIVTLPLDELTVTSLPTLLISIGAKLLETFKTPAISVTSIGALAFSISALPRTFSISIAPKELTAKRDFYQKKITKPIDYDVIPWNGTWLYRELYSAYHKLLLLKHVIKLYEDKRSKNSPNRENSPVYLSISEIKNSISEAKSIQNRYDKQLFRHEIPVQDLAFTNRVTRGTGQHKSHTIQADALNQLKWEGRQIEPGQKIRYILNDYTRKISRRVVPIEFAKNYDAKKYSELLDQCCKSIIEPFEN